MAAVKETCCGAISSGQGVKSFCLQEVVEGTDGCGTASHRVKADVAALAWCLRVRIRGNLWAGLADKRLALKDVLPEDRRILDAEKHAAGPWMSRFQVARLAKLGSGESLRAQADAGIPPEVGLQEHGKTPAKRRRVGDPEEVDESPSWVDVGSEGQGFEDVKTWGPLSSQDEINMLSQLNFDLLRRETMRAAGNWSDALVQIRQSTQQLLSAQSQTEIRVGTPGAFGASVGVVNAFDGLRHLMELLEDSESKFDAMPHQSLVTLTKRLDQSVVALTASDPWSTETTDLRRLIGVNLTNLGLLRDKSVGPLVALCNHCTERGHSVPGNRLSEAITKLQSEMLQVHSTAALAPASGPGVFGGPQAGFGVHVSQSGTGGTGLAALEARVSAAEQKNIVLEQELAMLRQGQSSGSSTNPFGVPPAGGGGGVAGSITQAFLDQVKNCSVRIDHLEAKNDGNAITFGVRIFRGISDCETFIRQEAPGGSLNTFCYDFISLLNRVQRRGTRLSPSDEVA
jgi:hypothetical protein